MAILLYLGLVLGVIGLLVLAFDGVLRIGGGRIVRPSEIKVVSGDTVEIGGQYCRLYGIAAPDWNQLGWGAAKHHLRKTVELGAFFVIKRMSTDKAGRPVIQMRTDHEVDVSADMVSTGHAVTYLHRGHEYCILMDEAREGLRGIWMELHAALPPRHSNDLQSTAEPTLSKRQREPRLSRVANTHLQNEDGATADLATGCRQVADHGDPLVKEVSCDDPLLKEDDQPPESYHLQVSGYPGESVDGELHVVTFGSNAFDGELLRLACSAENISFVIASDEDDFTLRLRRFPNSVGFSHVHYFDAVVRVKSDPAMHEKVIFVVNSYGEHFRHLFSESLNSVHELTYPFTVSDIHELLRPHRSHRSVVVRTGGGME